MFLRAAMRTHEVISCRDRARIQRCLFDLARRQSSCPPALRRPGNPSRTVAVAAAAAAAGGGRRRRRRRKRKRRRRTQITAARPVSPFDPRAKRGDRKPAAKRIPRRLCIFLDYLTATSVGRDHRGADINPRLTYRERRNPTGDIPGGLLTEVVRQCANTAISCLAAPLRHAAD